MHDLRLREYPTDLNQRTCEWIERIDRPRGPTVSAGDLYRGAYWSTVRELSKAAGKQGSKIEMWVASAGYGLLHIDNQVEGYSATFAAYSPDSVSRAGGGEAAAIESSVWWERLARRPKNTEKIACLRELAEESPRDPMVVVLSNSYLRALRRDLLEAEQQLDDPTRLFTVSVGTGPPEISHLQVPLDARFQPALGGSLGSLNVRAAKLLIEESVSHRWNGKVVRDEFLKRQESLPPIERPKGRSLSNDQVAQFLRDALKKDATATHSSLLRKLRDSGLSCEQRRFADLFATTLKGMK